MSGYEDQLRLYAEETRLAADAERRVMASLPTRRPRRWVRPVGLLLAALVLGGLFIGRPEPAPVPVVQELTASGAGPLGDLVSAAWSGSGQVSGDSRDLHVEWVEGDLGVEVTPDRGLALEVVTGEARVRVVGTGFDVRRDAFGTRVRVRHGVVAVGCGTAPEARLEAGAEIECQPVTAAALLGRARAQLRRGDPALEVVGTLARARAGAEGPVATEIMLLQAVELSRAGRPGEALVVTEAALLNPDPARRIELLRLAARLSYEVGGCARAARYDQALAEVHEDGPCAAANQGTPGG